MQCHVCGTEVRPEHKFCMECGARLRRPAGELALAPPTPTRRRPAGCRRSPRPPSHPMFDPATGQLLTVPPPPPLPPPDEDATNVLPAVGRAAGSRRVRAAGRVGAGSGPLGPPLRHRTAVAGRGHLLRRANPLPATTMQPPYRSEYDGGYYDATGRVPATYAPWEVAPWEQGEAPQAAADVPGQAVAGDLRAGGRRRRRRHGRPRPRRHRCRAARSTGRGSSTTSAPTSPSPGSLTALTMVLGAIAWCAGFRWGAGLAGGAGAGLAGWAALALGQAEVVVSTSPAGTAGRLGGDPRHRLLGTRRRRRARTRRAVRLARCAPATTGGPASTRGSPPSVRWPRSPP